MINIFNNIFKCVAMCLALVAGVASGMGCAGNVFYIALLGVLDLGVVIFLSWFEPSLEDCRLGMVIIEAILWFVGFFLILLI